MANLLKRNNDRVIDDPAFVKTLFSDVRFSVLWLVLRVWLGFQWITAATGKLGNPAWVETGDALKGYWTNAAAIPEAGRPAISFEWYRGFIQGMLDAEAYTWFAKLVAYGELFIGIGLVVGAFVGVAAFFGAVMNWNFMMAGTASTNPVLFVVALLLIVAWKTAGYIGLDYFLLNWLGTPWNRRKQAPASTTRERMGDALPAAGD